MGQNDKAGQNQKINFVKKDKGTELHLLGGV